MKYINLISDFLKGLIFIGSFILIDQCTYGQISTIKEGEDKIVLYTKDSNE